MRSPVDLVPSNPPLPALSGLIPRFGFRLPPYFINNARALSTLEGIAKSLDPSFNVLTVLYPYALNLLLRNPARSSVVDDTLQSLLRTDGAFDGSKLRRILRDSALITGIKKRRVALDVLRTRGGRKLLRGVVAEELNRRIAGGRIGRKKADRARRQKLERSSYYRYLNL